MSETRDPTSRQRRLSLVMVWTSFYEQLVWAPLLIIFAANAGNPESVAFATSAYSAANMGGNALFGLLADRIQRLKVAAYGFLAMAVTTVAHLWITDPAHLMTVRFLHGLAASAVAPAAFASLASSAPRRHRGEVMARAGFIIALASMISPALTGQLYARIGLTPTVNVVAIVLAAVGLAVLFSSSENTSENVDASASKTDESPALGKELSPDDHIDERRLGASFVVAFCLMFCQNILFYAFPLKTSALHFGADKTGAMLSAFAVGAVLTFVPPLSRLSDRVGRAFPVMIGLVIAAVSFIALAPAQTIPSMIVALFGYGLGFGLVFPALSALNADAVGANRRGMAFGMLTAAFSAGSVTGPLLTYGVRAWMTPFTGGAVMLSLAAVVTIFVLRPFKPFKHRSHFSG